MNNFKVYKHTFPNNKVYIGITKQKPKKRWENGKGYKGCDAMFNAVLKYGWDNIQHEILFEGLTYEEACEKEILLIALYKSNNRKYGYNIESGGLLNKEVTKETRKKLSEKATGNKNHMFGKKHTLETKQKIAKSCMKITKHLNKPIAMINPETNEVIAIFASAKQAAKSFGSIKKHQEYSH